MRAAILIFTCIIDLLRSICQQSESVQSEPPLHTVSSVGGTVGQASDKVSRIKSKQHPGQG